MGTIYIDFKVQGYCEDIKYSIHRYIHICVYIWCCIYIYICLYTTYVHYMVYVYVCKMYSYMYIDTYIYIGGERERKKLSTMIDTIVGSQVSLASQIAIIIPTSSMTLSQLTNPLV